MSDARTTDGHTTEEDGWTHGEAIVNGVRLHYVEAGAGPLVVLLHGFPEFWYGWRHQIGPLAAAGYHIVAPDMRGYNRSEKPAGVRAYAIENLVNDVAALIAYFGAARATVVGHDWGGVVAWETAMRRPDVVEKLIVLNAPHPGAFLRELRTPAQLARSWYAFAFQIPALPELLVALGNYRSLRAVFTRDPARPGAFTADDIERYRDALAIPGARTAAISYYRAALRRNPLRATADADRIVAAPALLIWGMGDRYLSPALTEGLERWVPHLRIERLADASHWVQHDAPERVTALIQDFLRERDGFLTGDVKEPQGRSV